MRRQYASLKTAYRLWKEPGPWKTALAVVVLAVGVLVPVGLAVLELQDSD